MHQAHLKIQLRPSKLLGFVICFTHIGAIHCVYFIPIYWPIKIALVFYTLARLVWLIKKHALKNSSDAITAIDPPTTSNKRWLVKKFMGHITKARINYPVFSSNTMLIIKFTTTEKEKLTVIICKDALSQDNFRKLKVVLKTAKLVEKSSARSNSIPNPI